MSPSMSIFHPPLLPRRHRERLLALERLWWVLAVDAHAAIEEMVAEGWDPVDAADAHASWLLGEVAHAVSFGREMWKLGSTAA